MRHAAIAIGSNSTRSLVADRVGAEYHVIQRGREETRLFLGMDDTGRITRERLESTVQAVTQLYVRAVSAGAEDCALFATSACRDAKNGRELEEMILKATGLRLRIISGEEEARLAFRAVAGTERLTVMDVGGGSTEMTLGENGRVLCAFSAQMGASRLMKMQPIGSEREAGIALEIARKALMPFTEKLLSLPEARGMIGLGGSCTAAAGIQAAREMHGELAEGQRVSLSELRRQLRWLSPLSAEERVRVPGLPVTRAAIMPHGLCILIAALELMGMEGFTVSGKNNLDGYIQSLPE